MEADFGLSGLSDHELLRGGLDDLVAENRFAARRLARLHELRIRRERDYRARKAVEPHFTLTPIQDAVIEAGALWGLSKGRLEGDLARTSTLATHFPQIWEMCLRGELDTYMSGLIAEQSASYLERDSDFAALASVMTTWLRKGIRDDPQCPPLVTRTVKQLRNKLTYELGKLKPKDADERFTRAFKERRASARMVEDGMGYLTLSNCVSKIQLADYRLSLVAKHLRAKGDQRTLEQLRTDLAVDLILGKIEIDPSVARLEAAEDEGGDLGEDWLRTLPTSGYARPIVNVTVPIQTLMGTSDAPGVLSGGTVIPASLARMIARDADSTWHRMLTDPAGEVVELSTKSYHPTAPIWRDVVARWVSCFRPNCDQPATDCELDHRVSWPEGATCSRNLQPGCRCDHKCKHSPGFSVTADENGRIVFATKAGFRHVLPPPQQPVCDAPPSEELFDFQYSATEFLDTLEWLRKMSGSRHADRSIDYQIDKLRAGFAASYPAATADEINYYISGDEIEGEHGHYAPPITTEALTTWEYDALHQLRREEQLASV